MARSCITHAGLLSALLTLAVGCTDKDPVPAVVETVPKVRPEILRSFAHDTQAFTQGLLHHGDTLYESTGAPAGQQSSIRVVDPDSGTVLRSLPVQGVFGEGIAFMDGVLLQLTWRSGIAIAYTLPALKRGAVVRYMGEGWGLTSVGSHYIMSNGSDTLLFRNLRFEIVKKLPVTHEGRPLSKLNELEFARGQVYANVWYSNYIFRIDPRSGATTQVIDCTELVDQASGGANDHVLNGIAYDSSRDEFYLTGKNWNRVFVARLP